MLKIKIKTYDEFVGNILQIFSVFMSWLSNRQLLEAGKAIQQNKQLEKDIKNVIKAKKARKSINIDANGDGLPDADKYKRD